MCGIAGFIGKGSEDDARRMINSICYRGPDYQGISLVENAGLAHARLSIIDLSPDANQPFFTPDRSAAIVFNGEIYNYTHLKEELLNTGRYSFRSQSDTEVLLYMYLEYGLNMFDKLNGMFAFAIYDFKKKQLMLAKDRFGKKPLYYCLFNDTLIFASELKAILQHPAVKKELNMEAVNEYLTFDYIPTPHTIFKNIYKLEASHYLTFNEDGIIKQAYWSPYSPPAPCPLPAAYSFPDAVLQLDSLLNAATRRRLMSDVPLGVFLSGGIDSSAVAYYAQKNSTLPIKTFSIGFAEKSYNESNYAQLVASRLGTEHHSQLLSAEESLNLVPEIVAKLDEPFADPSVIPTYYLSKFTRQHVTVALGGDGSDELLAGYPTFISDKFTGIMNWLPKPVIKALWRMVNLLPPSDKNISHDFKLAQFLKGFEMEKQYTHSLWLGSFTPAMKQKLWTKNWRDAMHCVSTGGSGLSCIDRYMEEVKGENEFNKLLYCYYRTYLQEDILVKVDRASMYNSLEVRAPFLDREVAAFLISLPKHFKIKGFTGKYILKETMRGKLPDEIIDRPKKGFGIPVSLWLRNQLKDTMENYLSPERIKREGLFDYTSIEKLKKEHLSRKRNHRKLLWNLLMLEMWFEQYY